MWSQSYYPLGGLVPSALLAAVPVILMLYLVGIARKPAWMSGLIGAASALLLALFGYHMPWGLAADAAVYGAAYGLLPIGWIVFTALLLYRLAVETGKFAIIKDSIGHLTSDTYMQALLIAFAFGAFIEGASGFGSPVAVASAMLVGLGMPAFDAAAICLLANTAPVAFGAIGTPLVSLQSVTAVLVHPDLFDPGDGREKSSGSGGRGGDGVRRSVRVHAILCVELRGSVSHRYPQLDYGDLRDGGGVSDSRKQESAGGQASVGGADTAGMVALHFFSDFRAAAERGSGDFAEALRRAVADREAGGAEGILEQDNDRFRVAGAA
jgi:hypothetical protein